LALAALARGAHPLRAVHVLVAVGDPQARVVEPVLAELALQENQNQTCSPPRIGSNAVSHPEARLGSQLTILLVLTPQTTAIPVAKRAANNNNPRQAGARTDWTYLEHELMRDVLVLLAADAVRLVVVFLVGLGRLLRTHQ
jgi:hypothetical protein